MAALTDPASGERLRARGLGGVLGTLIGLRPALWVATAGGVGRARRTAASGDGCVPGLMVLTVSDGYRAGQIR